MGQDQILQSCFRPGLPSGDRSEYYVREEARASAWAPDVHEALAAWMGALDRKRKMMLRYTSKCVRS